MLRGSQILLLLLLLAIIAGVGSYLYYQKNNKTYLPAAFALPNSATIVYQGNKPQTAYKQLQKNAFYQTLSQNAALKGFDEDYRFFDSLLKTNEDLQNILTSKPLLLSLHVTSAHSFQVLFLQQQEGAISRSDIEDYILEHNENTRLLERVFEGQKIYDVKTVSDKRSLFSFALLDGILALSRNTVLVEDAISAFTSNHGKSSPMITRLVKNNGQEKIYLNFRALPALLNVYISAQYISQAKSLQNLSEFGVYDYKLTEDAFLLEGNVVAGKASDHWKAFQNQKPQKITIGDVLPASTAYVMAEAVDNFGAYHKARNIGANNTDFDTRKNDLANKYSISFREEILPFVGNQWAYAILEPAAEEAVHQEVLVMQVDDSATAATQFRTLVGKVNSLKETTGQRSVYRGRTIEKVLIPAFLDMVFGEYYSAFQTPFYTVLGNHFVFANSQSIIERCIDAYTQKQSLSASAPYMSFTKNASGQGNFMLFINPGRAMLLGNKYANPDYLNRYKENYSTYKEAGAFGFMLSSAKDSLQSKIVLSKAQASQSSSELVWSLQLEDETVGKPYVVRNPDTKQKEILVQDKSKNLYLISNTGKILWKRNVELPIVGEVFQLDVYHNNDLQYLFSTTHKIFLLDRNGRDVGSYPLRLGSSTSTGVALFDFEENKNYTYYIADDNDRIYGFYANGKPLPGWSPLTVYSRLQFPVKYFKLKNQVYLLGMSDKGTLYVWDKNGKPAIKPIVSGTRIHNPLRFKFSATLAECAVFSVDTGGVLHTIRFDGNIRKHKLADGFSRPFFDYYDSDGNGKNEYILASGNKISAFDETGKNLWKIVTGENLAYASQNIVIGGLAWIGYTSKSANKVYLVSRAATMFPNFPVRGNTPFVADDLNGDGDYEIAVGGDGKMFYLYRLGR